MKPRLAKVTWARLVLVVLLLGCVTLLVSGPSLGSNWARASALLEADASAKVPWEVDANIGLQLAACLNIALLALLILSAGFLLRPFVAAPRARLASTGAVGGLKNEWRGTSEPRVPSPRDPLATYPSIPTSGDSPSLPRRLLWGLLVVVLVGTAARLPLASRSLWWDELWTIRQCSHGSWKFETADGAATEGGEWKFNPVTWKRAAFYYQKPTNHVPATLLQKVGLDFWRAITGAPRHAFVDLAARVPNLFLSALSLVLVALLLRSWGASVSAALLGAAVLALHPMAVRYGIETRGYALVIPLVLGALLAATRLLRRRGRDGWGWVGLVSCHALWLWAFPHGLLDVLIMALILAVLLMLAQANARDRVTVCLRLLWAELLAAMTLLQLFLPNVMQARHWAGQENLGHLISPAIVKNTLAQIATGLRWSEPGHDTESTIGLLDLRRLLPAPEVGAALLIVLALWLLWGLLKALRRGQRPVWLVAGLLLSGVLFALIAWKIELYYYPRFAIALVPVFALGIGLGREPLSRVAGKTQSVLLAALGSAFLIGLWPLLTRPIEPIRNVSDWLQAAGARQGTILAYGHGREALLVLKPEAVPVETAEQIRAAITDARAAGLPLHLVVGHLGFNHAIVPSGFAVIEDPAIFTEVARFEGIEAELHYRIYQLNPTP